MKPTFKRLCCASLVAVFTATGCATRPSMPLQVDFGDVPGEAVDLEKELIKSSPESTKVVGSGHFDENTVQPKWEELGPWGVVTANIEDSGYWTSKGRFETLSRQYEDLLGDRTALLPYKQCIPLFEAVEIAKNPNKYGGLELSDEQATLIKIIEEMLKTPTGKAIIEQLLDVYIDTLIGDHNLPMSRGYHDLRQNASFVGLDQATAIAQPTDMHSSVLFSLTLATMAEEIFHSYQNNILRNWVPSEEKRYCRVDEKFWHLSIEAQARLVAMCITVELIASGKSGIFDEDSSFLLEPSEMAEHVIHAYQTYGIEGVHQNPEVLFEAFGTFLSDINIANSYGGNSRTNMTDINAIDPNNTDYIPIEVYNTGFGFLPGMDKSFLDGQMSKVSDLLRFVPAGTLLGNWLFGVQQARAEGRPDPDLPSPAFELAAEDTEQNAEDGEFDDDYYYAPLDVDTDLTWVEDAAYISEGAPHSGLDD